MRKSLFRAQQGPLVRKTPDDTIDDLRRCLHLHERGKDEREAGLLALAKAVGESVEPDSPVLEVLRRTGDRWSTLIVSILQSGTYRNSELIRIINTLSDMCGLTHISQRILTLKLRELERDGLVERAVLPGKLPRTDYYLTPLGRSFIVRLLGVVEWAGEHASEIRAAQSEFDYEEAGRAPIGQFMTAGSRE